ncbi:aspartic proteinase nepenthesin-2-like [Melia azedarach]|uniref:Aspartic proteinase nepenthesin-2-like n=1 Tax=Melia azedarach TaxID=155640 RepID=A0ACC1X1V5_MELAZ|nr:aspartic proteinase nepenthesin-2-like [Melia azedarach]
MASPSCPFALFCFFSLLTVTATTASTITLPLTPISTKHPSNADQYKILNSLASSSLSRAHQLKTKTKANSSSSSSSHLKTPLFSHSYGGYTVSLSFGTPPQTMPFVFDTGSSLVWFPCTSSYLCSDCSFPNVDPNQIPTYIPKHSSSSKLIGCQNPKCSWIFGPNVQSTCKDCDGKSKNCTQGCPPYIIQYGLGSTAGLLLSESLRFPERTVPDFLVGCSVISNRQPAGIAGFGRSSESLPSQMKLKKFSYCLLPRRFDDAPVSSNLVLDTGSDSGDSKTPGLSYTPFYSNPIGLNSAFGEYYYVGLRKIVVGNKHVKIPYKYLVPGSDGNGGSIVDSGSTFTFLEKPVFEAVAEEFIKQMGNYSRATDVENKSGLKPCFDISGKKLVNVPELTLLFKGGAKMALPLENYFAFIGGRDVICLMFATDNVVGPQLSGGPAIILGDFQLQNFYVEFDLANNRFGYAKQKCT